MALDIAEYKELIISSYERTLDLDTAIFKLQLNEDQVQEIMSDEEFLFRIRMIDISIQEDVVGKLRMFANSPNEATAFKATMELGKIYYKKKFETGSKLTLPTDGSSNIKVILTRGDEDE